MPDVAEIYDEMKYEPSADDRTLIERAYTFARDAHEGYVRNSGEPYFNHVVATAKNLARYGMDATTIAAGLLHDTVEDTDVTEAQLQETFNAEIAFLVQGVTKLGHLKYRGRKRHVESLRKFFMAMAEDIRVVVIKLCDRLHNLQTLTHVREDKQKRIALESIEIHGPLAERLGMGLLRKEIQDTAFPYAYPDEYELVEELLKQKKKATQKYVEDVYKKLMREVAQHAGVSIVESDYRIKGKYSLYKKLSRNDMDIDKIYDIVALRLIVPSVEDCYRVLGIIHMMWRPLPGRIKDYIANPKPNGYKSLHTTIFVGNGGIAEIQIRTSDMHEEAEYGIASHALYKDKTQPDATDHEWIQQLQELQKTVDNPKDFLKNLKTDFFTDRIFVYTPEGDVIDLPQGASAIDFAFAVHTEIGMQASGSKINGKYSALKSNLSNGDIVEIETNEKSHPTNKWLEHAKTTLARRHIRNYLREHNLLQRFFNI